MSALCLSGNLTKGDFPGKEIKSVQLQVTALGVYEAQLNGKRVGDYVLAPWLDLL